MTHQVEPPVLISRLMMFVMAAAIVVAGAMGITLWRLFPLNRPQVFFLTTEVQPDMEVHLYGMPIRSDARSASQYKMAFIKEYIKARNEIVPDVDLMQRKWGNGADGVVEMWSTGDVFDDFAQTTVRSIVMQPDAEINVTCTVEFPQRAIEEYTADKMTYSARFNYLCTNSDGQTTGKDYKIIITLENEEEPTIKWGDRLNNPLGVRVAEYKIEGDNGDPLDFN
ncbi:hypothetical protein HDR66_00060 [bacterium]|nr:hypothetical protein [bacterium]